MNPAQVSTFAVRQFSVKMGADGCPTQKTTSRGDEVSVGPAFSVARPLAELERERRARAASLAGAVRAIALVDAERGEDRRPDGLVTTRLWVRDRPPASPGVGEKKAPTPGAGAGRPIGGDDRRKEKRRAYFSAAPMRARAVTTFSRELNALMRTWPSPHLPKPAPGVQTTWAWLSNRSKNSHESRPVLIQR